MAKMIDQIHEELEFHHGYASEVKAKIENLTGDAKEQWKRDLDREMEKLLIIKKLLEASLPAAHEEVEHTCALDGSSR